jgi:hypothetical protein
MTEIFLALAVLACPLGMGAMMWFMMRGSKHSGGQSAPAAEAVTEAELHLLREEVNQLRAEQKAATPAEQTGR